MTKQKVALFQRVGDFAYLTTWNFPVNKTDDMADQVVPDGYVRISPWLEIDFPALDTNTVIEKQLQQLDKAEQAAREELQRRLNQINDTRRKLLALSAPVAA